MNPAKGKVAGKVAYVQQQDRILLSVRSPCPTFVPYLRLRPQNPKPQPEPEPRPSGSQAIN
jgi:hypothetical protein